LEEGRLKLVGWLAEVDVRMVPPEEAAPFDPHGLAFRNLNTPEEFQQAEEQARLEDVYRGSSFTR
jgi:molybdopterin-guanine dinucleotide biosynthesis protein A